MVVIVTHPQPQQHAQTPSNTKLGGTYPDTAGIPFADTYELSLIYTTMQSITNGCTPPIFPTPAPIYNVLKTGTLASTQSSWAQYKTQYNGTGAGQCYFYGLAEATLRDGITEGPADLCHAFLVAGLQFFAVNNLTVAQQNDLFGMLDLAILTAFPLNMYWKNSLGLNWDVNLANALLTSVVLPFIAGTQRDIRVLATGFCNPSFASDQPNYFTPALLPRLAFPWEGLVDKLAKTVMTNPLQAILGGLTIPAGLGFKNVYIISDPSNPNGLDPGTNGEVNSFIQAALGGSGAPVTVLNAPVAESLNAILNSVFTTAGFINPDAVPVLVIGRYIDDAQTYQSFKVQPNTIMFALSPDDPPDFLQGQNLGVVLQNAASSGSISVFDFDVEFAFEPGLGPDFHPAHGASDFLNLLIGTHVYAGSTAAFGILDTFAIKNTLVAGVDVGGRMTRVLALNDLVAQGISLGLVKHSFSMELIQNVANYSAGGVGGGGNQPAGGSAPPPASYDWRATAPQCVPPATNQQSCENCWAHSSTQSMSARICIAFGIAQSNFLSIQQVTACSTNLVTNTNGCDPQYPSTGFTFMSGDMTTTSCMPVIFTTANAGGCPTQCANGGKPPLAGGTVQGTYRALQTAADIKQEILANGPIAVGITVPSDILSYFPLSTPTSESVIYPISASTNFFNPGGHMVQAWGWDDTTHPPSWIIKNSWGGTQGNNGFIRLAQDVNNVLTGKVPWVDTQGFTATPRQPTQPTDPVAVILSTQTTAGPSNAPGSQTAIFTATISCPNMILNANQSTAAASIQGCPNSASTLQKNIAATAPSPGVAARPLPELILLLCIILCAWQLF